MKNVSRVNVVEQIPTAFCSTAFSNNNYTCDPNLRFTTWCVVPNEIFGPWMSRRGQGRCSDLVKNMLTQIFDAPFEKFRYTGKEEARQEGGIMKSAEKSLPRTI